MKIETTIENIKNIIDFLKPDTKIILEIDEEKEDDGRRGREGTRKQMHRFYMIPRKNCSICLM